MKQLVIANEKFPVIQLPGRPPAILDRHVAKIYEVDTKQINRAVKRNPQKFLDGYYYQLTLEEIKLLGEVPFWHLDCKQDKTGDTSKVEKFDLGWKGGHLPKVFTHRGCNMLATILQSGVAIERAVQIVEGFTRMEQIFQTSPPAQPAKQLTAELELRRQELMANHLSLFATTLEDRGCTTQALVVKAHIAQELGMTDAKKLLPAFKEPMFTPEEISRERSGLNAQTVGRILKSIGRHGKQDANEDWSEQFLDGEVGCSYTRYRYKKWVVVEVLDHYDRYMAPGNGQKYLTDSNPHRQDLLDFNEEN